MADKTARSRGLGRGLSALMADVAPAEEADTPQQADRQIPIDRIQPNPDQPRRQFDDSALSELAASIRERGIIQPLIVRPDPADDERFQIVAGERRWRAAQIAQLHEVPALIRDYTDTEVLEVAIIENVQRTDLNPVDEAAGYRQLMDRFGHTQEQLATVLGKSRSHIANLLRLLSLPGEVLTFVTDGRLSAGHARALVGHDNALDLARRIVKNGLSVREAEKLTRSDAAPKRPARPRAEKDADTVMIEKELAATLGMGVSIDHKPGQDGGTLTLRYRDFGQLDDLLRTLSGG